MFTGLVQAMGHLEPCPHGVWVRGDLQGLGALALGDSVAVDGVCLTVAESAGDGRGFRADVSEETLSRTTLGRRAGAHELVNLESALRLSDRLGGHLVSGHVDGTGRVVGIEVLASSWQLTVAWQDPTFARYVCEKGSIALDGISLTVAGTHDGEATFSLAIIPHTWQSTTLRQRRVGDVVNLEVDLLARYTERLLRLGDSARANPAAVSLTRDWLADHGW
jgi:riboflavin synthase